MVVNDGFGDEPREGSVSMQTGAEIAKGSVEKLHDILIEHGWTRGAGGAFVPPVGKNAKAGPSHGPVVGSMGGQQQPQRDVGHADYQPAPPWGYERLVDEKERARMMRESGAELLAFPDEIAWRNDAGSNLPFLRQTLLTQHGWTEVPGRVGRIQSAEGVVVEMGYALDETWYRIYAPKVGTGVERPIDSGKMLKWDADDPAAGSRGALADILKFVEITKSGALIKGERGPELPVQPGMKLAGTHVLPFQLLSQTAKVPTRAYLDDAGFDLYVDLPLDEGQAFDEEHEVLTIRPGEFVDVPCGVAVGLPAGYWARLVGRSSTLRRKGLLVAEGIIDSGYTGPLFAGVWNLTGEPVRVEHGERLAQLIIHQNDTARFVASEATELRKTQRGDSGFGSSGS